MARTAAVCIAGLIVAIAVAAMATTRKSSVIFFDAPEERPASAAARPD